MSAINRKIGEFCTDTYYENPLETKRKEVRNCQCIHTYCTRLCVANRKHSLNLVGQL